MMIHCALRAGASLADIAEATGLDADEVVRRWERWTEVQTQMDIGGRPAVTPVEVRTIRNRIGLGVGQ
jgi:transposase-like protein